MLLPYRILGYGNGGEKKQKSFNNRGKNNRAQRRYAIFVRAINRFVRVDKKMPKNYLLFDRVYVLSIENQEKKNEKPIRLA